MYSAAEKRLIRLGWLLRAHKHVREAQRRVALIPSSSWPDTLPLLAMGAFQIISYFESVADIIKEHRDEVTEGFSEETLSAIERKICIKQVMNGEYDKEVNYVVVPPEN